MANIKLDKQSYIAEPLYQWDKNQTLTIYGMSLPSIPEIHFANASMDRAIVRQSTMDANGIVTVEVPNSLLQKPQNVIVYVCIYSGNTFETWYKFEVPLKARQKPSDYTIEDTDGEIYSFRELENKIDETVAEINAQHDKSTTNYNEAVAALEESKTSYEDAKQQIIDEFATQLEQNGVDVSTKVDKVTTATEGNIVVFAANGNIKDSGETMSTLAEKIADEIAGGEW